MKNKYLYIFLLLNLFKEAKSLSKKDFIYYFKKISPAIGATSLLLACNIIPKIKFYENNKKFKKLDGKYNNKIEQIFSIEAEEIKFISLKSEFNSINPDFIIESKKSDYEDIKQSILNIEKFFNLKKIYSDLLKLNLQKIEKEKIEFFFKAHNVNESPAQLLEIIKSINGLLDNIKASINFIKNEDNDDKNSEELKKIMATFEENFEKLTEKEKNKNITDVSETTYSDIFRALENNLKQLNSKTLLEKKPFIKNFSILFTDFLSELYIANNNLKNPSDSLSNFLENILQSDDKAQLKSFNSLKNNQDFLELLKTNNDLKKTYEKTLNNLPN